VRLCKVDEWQGILSTGDQIAKRYKKYQYLPIIVYLAACGENLLPRARYSTLFTSDQKFSGTCVKGDVSFCIKLLNDIFGRFVSRVSYHFFIRKSDMETAQTKAPPGENIAEHRNFISVMKLLYVFVSVIYDACQMAIREDAPSHSQLCSRFMKSIGKLYKRHPDKFKAYTYILNELWAALNYNRLSPAWDKLDITLKICANLKEHIITECASKGINILREIESDIVNNRNFFDEGKK